MRSLACCHWLQINDNDFLYMVYSYKKYHVQRVLPFRRYRSHVAWTIAPRSSKKWTISKCSELIANCNGVFPKSSASSGIVTRRGLRRSSKAAICTPGSIIVSVLTIQTTSCSIRIKLRRREMPLRRLARHLCSGRSDRFRAQAGREGCRRSFSYRAAYIQRASRHSP